MHLQKVSKNWNTFHSKEGVKKSLDECLERFGFDYLDLFLIHWPMGFKVKYLVKITQITKLLVDCEFYTGKF